MRVELQGHVNPGYEPVAEAFRRNLATGKESQMPKIGYSSAMTSRHIATDVDPSPARFGTRRSARVESQWGRPKTSSYCWTAEVSSKPAWATDRIRADTDGGGRPSGQSWRWQPDQTSDIGGEHEHRYREQAGGAFP